MSRAPRSRPRRVVADLEPLEVRPRAVMVGSAHEVQPHPSAVRSAIYVRPAMRVEVTEPTYGEQLRDAALAIATRAKTWAIWAVQALRRRLSAIDDALWDPSNEIAFWGNVGLVVALGAVLCYFIAQLARAEMHP